MRRKLFAHFFAAICLCLALANATAYAGSSPEALARLAVSDKPAESGPAVAELRAMGPAGLKILFSAYGEEIRRAVAGGDVNEQEWQRLTAALDAVSQQRNSYASGLYWYTDFEQAKAAAKASGKAILSLRLLGNLSEEFSCANSRFFRTVLYANTDVSRYLRENFVLHWKSVRPAPRVTIDFGDGRKLERTLTGNSIHYVLDSNGLPVDALPGLYGPEAFARGLHQAEALVKQLAGKDAAARRNELRDYHNKRIQAIAADWASDVARTGGKVPADVTARIERRKANPNAVEIAPLAISKRIVEIDILKAIMTDADALEAITDLPAWGRIANLHTADSRLDAGSIALMTRQNPALSADRELLSRTVKNLERYMALDTARNEYMMHAKIHGWFYAGRTGDDVDRLNALVYSQLFQTPDTDPWLGLYAPDVYTALDGGGIK